MIVAEKINDFILVVLGLKKEHLLLSQDALVLLFINGGGWQRQTALVRRVAVAYVPRLHLCVKPIVLILLLSVRNNRLGLFLGARPLQLAVLVGATVHSVGTGCCLILCRERFFNIQRCINLFDLEPLS